MYGIIITALLAPSATDLDARAHLAWSLATARTAKPAACACAPEAHCGCLAGQPCQCTSQPKHGDVQDGWTYHRDGYWWRYAPTEAPPVLSLPTYSGPVWGPAVGVGGGSCSS